MIHGKPIKMLKLFLVIIFLHLLVPVIYAQQNCCSFSNAEMCITGGHPYDAQTCTCNNNACEYMLIVQCNAAGQTINSSCQCSCALSAAQYCTSINRVMDPSTCQCAGCLSSAEASCNAEGGMWNSSTCTCVMNSPCSTQYITLQNGYAYCHGIGYCLNCELAYLCWDCDVFYTIIGLGGVYCGEFYGNVDMGCSIDYNSQCGNMPGCCMYVMNGSKMTSPYYNGEFVSELFPKSQSEDFETEEN